MRREAFPFLAAALSVCGLAPVALAESHDALIARHATANGVPEHLVRRVIRIESRGNAAAVHKGNYGLMQIRLGTARGVGYSGDAQGLLDADTNLTYAVKYLAGAYRAAGCDPDRAVSYYQRGYYGSPRIQCGSPSTPLLQLAQAEPLQPEGKTARKRERAAAKRKPETEPASSADVIKPKVVRTETIATSKSDSAPARPVGNFEPRRVAPPPAPPSAAMKPASAGLQPAAGHPAVLDSKTSIELASVPLPHARPEQDIAPKPALKPLPRLGRTHERTDKKSGTRAKSDTTSQPATTGKPADPTGVVSFLKKLVTPDKKPRNRSSGAEVESLPHVQPLQ
jgi:hypothetical protein